MLPQFSSAQIMLTNVHKGALQDCALPVHNVQGVEVAKCTCNFSSIEPGSGLQEDPLSLEMVEELERKQANICQHQYETHFDVLTRFRSVVLDFWVSWDLSLPLRRWHSRGQSTACRWSGRSSAAPPGRDAWCSSSARCAQPWCACAGRKI